MNNIKYRKYIRTIKKDDCQDTIRENPVTLEMSGAIAIGILAFTFIKGFFWGYKCKGTFLS